MTLAADPPIHEVPLRPAALSALTLLVIAAVVVGRSWDAFAHPILFAEDGTTLFAHFYAHRDWTEIFRPYAGYVSVVPNAVGWLSARLPLDAQPYALSWFAGAVTTSSMWLFSSRRFAHVMPSMPWRCFCCVMLALLPVGSFRVVSVAMYAIWSMLFAVALLAVAAPPRRGARTLLEAVAVALCIASHPVAAVLLPIYAWRAWRSEDRWARAYFTWLALCVCAYQAFGVEHAGRVAASIPVASARAAELLGTRVLVEPAVGLTGSLWLRDLGFAWLLPVLAAASAAWVAWRCRALDMPARKFVVLAIALVCAISLAVAAGSANPGGPGREWGHRYSYVQFLLCYLAALVCLIGVPRPRERTHTVALLLLLHTLALNVHNREYYATRREDGEQVRYFCANARAWHDEGASHPAELCLHRYGWSIVLRRTEPPN